MEYGVIGFEVVVTSVDDIDDVVDFVIGNGVVGGIICDLEEFSLSKIIF